MPNFTQVYDSTSSHELVGLGFSGWICFLCDERKGRNGVVTVMDCWSSLKLFDFDINREGKKRVQFTTLRASTECFGAASFYFYLWSVLITLYQRRTFVSIGI